MLVPFLSYLATLDLTGVTSARLLKRESQREMRRSKALLNLAEYRTCYYKYFEDPEQYIYCLLYASRLSEHSIFLYKLSNVITRVPFALISAERPMSRKQGSDRSGPAHHR